MRLSLVVTTYERPDALAAVLATAAAQRQWPAEIIVADDGSGPATREVVAAFAARAPAPVAHVRQEHDGFRAARLRNLAIAAARGDYLVFVDGDMLLHPEFIADHCRAARPGCFVQGVRIPLDAETTKAALAALPGGPGAAPRHAHGLRRIWTLHSPALARCSARIGNAVVATKSCNLATWRDDLLAVNGFNHAMVGWGPEDKELCARLGHLGRRRRALVFGGIAWHLHHPPAARDRRARNEAILAATRRERTVRCEHGLAELAQTTMQDGEMCL
jgi:glycosyltransferase involved in cell wall biosynthesis